MDEFVTLDSISASVIFPNCGHLVYSNALPLKKDAYIFSEIVRMGLSLCGRPILLIGTLSKDDDDGSENVGKKINLRSFKLNRVYSNPFNTSNAGDFSWSWILKDFIQVQKEEGKFVDVCPRPPIKRQIRRFHVVIVQWTSKKCTKKRDVRAELLFWLWKPLFFEVVIVVVVDIA